MVCPETASFGISTSVCSDAGLMILTVFGYVPTWNCHHFTVTLFPSGSDTAPLRRIFSPAEAMMLDGDSIFTTGSWLASLNFGVTAHLKRAAKSCCAAGKKSG